MNDNQSVLPKGGSIPLVSASVMAEEVASTPVFPQTYSERSPVALGNLETYTTGHPWEAYAHLRNHAPVAWNDDPVYGNGFWSVVLPEDIKTVELDTETYSSQRGGINLNYGAPEVRHPQLYAAALNTMICLDAPWHLPLRREHMAFFTPAYISKLQNNVAGKIDALLDMMEDEVGSSDIELDFVESFSAQLPMFTLCEMLGIPESDRPQLIKWMHHLEMAADTLARRGAGGLDPQFVMTFLTEMTALFAYGREVLEERRKTPRDDLLSAIANATINGTPLSEEYLDGSWLLILFAGNDTTRNSLSGMIRLMTEFPDQRALLLNNWEYLPNCVDETIRMVTPVIYMRRTATKDTVLRHQKIAEGEKVAVYYGAANRDPQLFANPDRYDITRHNASDHIAFGLGPHVCLGKRIALMQLETAIKKIFTRFPSITWTGNIDIAPNNFVHAISKLGVTLKP